MQSVEQLLQDSDQTFRGVIETMPLFAHSAIESQAPRARLPKAMSYSLLAPAKRLRPTLVFECCRGLGGSREAAVASAAAVEIIHTYSLVHDDLPCMDDDDLRRGQPTNHKVFGEAMAVLAGDGLLTYAFELLSADPALSADRRIRSIEVLARAAGPEGMVAGQALDLEMQATATLPHEQLEEILFEIHRRKTGCLISAACELGSIAAGATGQVQAEVANFGRALGLTFQIVDDLLDVEGGERLGKTKGADEHQGKLTFVTLFGLDETRRRAAEMAAETRDLCVKIFPEPKVLLDLISFVVERRF